MAELLQARCPTNCTKALKDNTVAETATCHHAAEIGQEHYDGCVGCLAIRVQGSIP